MSQKPSNTARSKTEEDCYRIVLFIQSGGMDIQMFSSEQIVVMILIIIVLIIPYLRKLFFSSVQQKNIVMEKRLAVFDQLRGWAILAVIGIHVVQFFIEAHPESAGRETSHFVINNILRFAVPVFFICSGILLDPVSVTTREGLIRFYTRKWIRLFIPYMFCSIAVDLFIQSSFNTIVWNIVAGRVLPPYYFMAVLFQLYLIYPLLVRLRKKRWFLPMIFALSVGSFFQPQTWWFFGVSTLLPYLYFFAFGIAKRDEYLLSERTGRNADIFVWLLIVIYIGFSIVRPEYYFNMRFIYGIAVFHILSTAIRRVQPTIFQGFISLLGRHSLWIYLIHFPITQSLMFFIGFTQYPYYARMGSIYVLVVVSSLVYSVILARAYTYLFKSFAFHR